MIRSGTCVARIPQGQFPGNRLSQTNHTGFRSWSSYTLTGISYEHLPLIPYWYSRSDCDASLMRYKRIKLKTDFRLTAITASHCDFCSYASSIHLLWFRHCWPECLWDRNLPWLWSTTLLLMCRNLRHYVAYPFTFTPWQQSLWAVTCGHSHSIAKSVECNASLLQIANFNAI